MECGICLNEYDSRNHVPTLLDCGHTFCRNCIEDLLSSHQKLCPIDRNPIGTRLVPNYELLSLLELRSQIPIRNPDENELKCKNGHFLACSEDFKAEYEGDGMIFKCKLCKREVNDGWLCKLCIFAICDECKRWSTDTQEINEPGILCTKNHKIRLTPNAEEWNARIGRFKNGKFLCDTCLVKKTGASAQCRVCNFDMCADCYYKLRQVLPMVEYLNCKNKHPLVWLPDFVTTRNKDFACNGCKKRFNKSGSFNCGLCRFDLCIWCAENRILNYRNSIHELL